MEEKSGKRKWYFAIAMIIETVLTIFDYYKRKSWNSAKNCFGNLLIFFAKHKDIYYFGLTFCYVIVGIPFRAKGLMLIKLFECKSGSHHTTSMIIRKEFKG